MNHAPVILCTAALTLLPAASPFTSSAEKRALYPTSSLLNFFTKVNSAELKITRSQEKELEASRERRGKIWQRHVKEEVKVVQSKLPEAEKNAKLRALETRASADVLKVYGDTLRPAQLKRMKQIILQVHGMEIFDYPEVRKALKIGDAEVKELRAAYDKYAREYGLELRAGVDENRITDKEAAQKAFSMTFSVPDPVRELLSKEQRKALEDLLGKKYNYGR